MITLTNDTSQDTMNPNVPIYDATAQAHHAHQTSTKGETAQFYHQALFSPPPVTLLNAIKNHQTFPGLVPLLLKHLPKSTATARGHMHKNCKDFRSTKGTVQAMKDAILDLANMNPPHQVCAAQERNVVCYTALADTNKGTVYTDLPGPFPTRSIRNMQYIFVCYVYEANTILVRPMKSRSDACMVAAYKDIYEYLELVNQKPTLNVTDNEASKAVQAYIKSKDDDWQLAEPDNHHVNPAEQAIQTFKNNFLTCLATVDTQLLLQLWCYLLIQAEMTLNMLRTSLSDPSKSAYKALEGTFNYNKTPLAPPGTKTLIYEVAARRASWAPHAVDGWYLGPAMKHYRCGHYFITHTPSHTHCQLRQALPHRLQNANHF